MHLVATTKALIQKLREDGWDSLVGEVKLFCERYEIEIPDMSARLLYVILLITRWTSTHTVSSITIE